MTAHTLKIRCPTWDHLENFCERKIKEGNVLLARVPFCPPIGAPLTISLELPSGIVVDIEATVDGVRAAPDGRKSAVRMVLHGMTEVLRTRLQKAIETGRSGKDRVGPLVDAALSIPRTRTGLLVPIPADAPVDEVVTPTLIPELGDVAEEHRAQFEELLTQLQALREKAAHDVLGVSWDADVQTVRRAYFKMTKRFHPDVLAKHQSSAVSLMASELFIYINKAYDRLRDSAVAAGEAIVAGPALLPHKGWIADFSDIGTIKPRTPLRSDDLSGPAQVLAKRFEAPASKTRVEVQFEAKIPIVAVPASPEPVVPVSAVPVAVTAVPATAVPVAVTAVAVTAVPATAVPATAVPATAVPVAVTAVPVAVTAVPVTAVSVTALPAGVAVPAVAVVPAGVAVTAVPVTAVPTSNLRNTELFIDARRTTTGMEPLAKAPVVKSSEPSPRDLADAGVILNTGKEQLKGGNHEEARTSFAKLLETDPRHRIARALYHVAYGHTLLDRGKAIEARTQFEVALTHDPKCAPAQAAVETVVKPARAKRPSFFQRLFRK